MPQFIEPYVELGRKLDEAFRKAQYAEAAFSDLAVEHVERARLHEHFDLIELARWVIAARDIPPQEDIRASFGDPPVTLWNGRRFFVSALVWGSSTTAIHQHAFTGAFQVLQGSSVHARYTFQPSLVISENLAAGRVKCLSMEYLTKGMTRPISEAAGGIHSLFHLDHPSVSLVVRTHIDRRYPIQLSYLPPGLAIFDQKKAPEIERAKQILRTLLRLGTSGALGLLAGQLVEIPADDVYWLLDEVRRETSLDKALRLISHCGDSVNPAMANAFADALREEDRRANLCRRRDQVRDPALRYFLAVLLNAVTRREVFDLVTAYQPSLPPEETVLKWLIELADVKFKLQAGGEPWEPNVLGLPMPDDASIIALRAALVGGLGSAEGNLKFYDAVRRNVVFSPLFSE